MPEQDVKVPGRKQLEVYVDAPYVVVRLTNPVKVPFADFAEHHLSEDEAAAFLTDVAAAIAQNKIVKRELRAAQVHGTDRDQIRIQGETERREAAIRRMEEEGALNAPD